MSGAREQHALDLMLARVIGRLVHDLKNPLTAVVGNLRFLVGEALEGDSGEAVGEALEAVEVLSQQLDDTVDLQRARLGRLVARPRPTDLGQLQQRLQQVVRTRVGSRRLTLSLPERQMTVDGELLQRVLVALVVHGLRHSAPGQAVSLQGELSADGLQVELVDGGLPFAPDRPVSLVADGFDDREPLDGYRSDQGLGLMFVGAVVRSLGGRAAVTSPVDGEAGARFVLTIPC